MDFQMTPQQRAELQQRAAELDKQGVRVDVGGKPPAPTPEHATEGVADNVTRAVGMPANYFEREDDGSMAATLRSLDGVPCRLTPGADLSKILVQAGGIPMTVAQAVQHGFAVQGRDGVVTFADQLKPAATTSKIDEQPKVVEVTPAEKAAAAEMAELGTEVAAATRAWSEVGLDAGAVGIAAARQDEATMQRAMDALVRGGLAANTMEAYEWINDLVAHGEARLTAELEAGGLDGARVLQAMREDRSLQGDVERGAAIYANTGSLEGFGAALQKLADSGKLAGMFKKEVTK